MKSIAITALVCGTTLILVPFVHDIMATHMVVELIQQGHPQVNLSGPLSSYYSPWCMFIGICVIVSGLVMGWRSQYLQEARALAGTFASGS